MYLYALLFDNFVKMGTFKTFIFMFWKKISPFICFKQECLDSQKKMSGILDPRIPPFRRSGASYANLLQTPTEPCFMFSLYLSEISFYKLNKVLNGWYLIFVIYISSHFYQIDISMLMAEFVYFTTNCHHFWIKHQFYSIYLYLVSF